METNEWRKCRLHHLQDLLFKTFVLFVYPQFYWSIFSLGIMRRSSSIWNRLWESSIGTTLFMILFSNYPYHLIGTSKEIRGPV